MGGEFRLRRATIEPQVMVTISAERYDALRSARLTLIDAGAFEHRYEILLGNYIAFEHFCSEWSLRGEIEMDHRYERWAKVILEANRHIMNLLSAARSYSDHVAQDFKHLALSPTFMEQAKTQLSVAYDGSLAYRFFCALRNHVQHRAAPVHGITHSLKGKSLTDTMMVYCAKGKLEESGGFKAAVLAELDDQIDLRGTARAYMSAVSEVHVELRKRVKSIIDQARKLHEEAIAEFVSAQEREEPGTPGIGLTICRESESGFVNVHPILLSWDDVRILLAEKNRFALKPA